MGAASRRPVTPGIRRLLRPHELVALAALAAVLLPGLALVAISPGAWPIPAVAAAGVLVLLVRAGLRPAAVHRDAVAAEAATGVSQIEAWLSERHRT